MVGRATVAVVRAAAKVVEGGSVELRATVVAVEQRRREEVHTACRSPRRRSNAHHNFHCATHVVEEHK